MSGGSKEEERILRSMTRKTNRQSVTFPVSKTHSEAYRATFASPNSHTSNTSNTSQASHHSEQLEQLLLKKRAVLGYIGTTRRDLEELRKEIEKLKTKEAEIVNLLEKREAAVQQLTQQIEELESAENAMEESRRKAEEEKARYLREEIERRKKEEEEERKKREEEAEKRRKEEEEERKKKEEERKKKEEERKKLLIEEEEKRKNATPNPTLNKQPSSSSFNPTPNPTLNKQPSSSSFNPTPNPTLNKQPSSSAFNPRTPSSETLDGTNPEEARILRAMSRAKPGGSVGRTSNYRSSVVTTEPKPKPQPTVEPAWKEQERIREAERQARIAEENKRKEEENKRKEEERRAMLEKQEIAKQAEQQRVLEIQKRGGTMRTFTSPTVYDFDVEVKICGDFTDWEEIPITTSIDGNFQYSISFPVERGIHFYRFKIGNKWDVNKNLPTGVAPSGEVMNKIDVQ